jgi:hypothetical protein
MYIYICIYIHTHITVSKTLLVFLITTISLPTAELLIPKIFFFEKSNYQIFMKFDEISISMLKSLI